MHAVQVAGFFRWRLQQLRSEGSENPAQVLSTARNALRRVRMVMRGLPQRELTEEGKRLIGSIQHEAAQETKQARMRCVACSTPRKLMVSSSSPACLPACLLYCLHAHCTEGAPGQQHWCQVIWSKGLPVHSGMCAAH
jgi:hypothetical protein